MNNDEKQSIVDFKSGLINCSIIYFIMILSSIIDPNMTQTESNYFFVLSCLIMTYKEIGIYFNDVSNTFNKYMSEVKILMG